MSFPTTPAFITYTEGWSKTRNHPAMAWMEKYTEAFDSRSIYTEGWQKWWTDDHVYAKANGQVISGGEQSWAAVVETYAPFKGTLHEPNWLVVWETANGWEMVGQAKIFGDLHAPGEKSARDLTGKGWDVTVPGAFHFEYVKDPSAPVDGLKLKRTEIFADSGPIVMEAVKRGMMKPEQLFGQ